MPDNTLGQRRNVGRRRSRCRRTRSTTRPPSSSTVRRRRRRLDAFSSSATGDARPRIQQSSSAFGRRDAGSAVAVTPGRPSASRGAGTEKPKPTRASGVLRSSMRRIEPSGTISASGASPSSPRTWSVTIPIAGLRLDAQEREARAVDELDLDGGRLHAVLLGEVADRAVDALDEGLVRAFGDRRPDAAQKSLCSSAGAAPMCARPSFVIVRPRGVRWMKPSCSRYGS